MRATICLVAMAMVWVSGVVHAGEDVTHLWTFDENEGGWADDAMGSQAGDVYGAKWTDGRIGGGLWFDGEDDYVTLPDNDPVWLPINDFTISFWVYFERDQGSSIDENEALVDFNAGSSSDPENELGYIVFRHGANGTFAFQMATMENTDEDLESQLIPVKDRWYHVVAVRQGALQAIYIDGRLDASRTCSSSAIDFVGGYDDDQINVGRYTTTIGWPRYYFKGMLDEVMLSDRAWSSEEIGELYQQTLASRVLYVDGTQGSDQNDGLRPLTALATIQKAVSVAQKGDVVFVRPGVYREAVHLPGRAITLQSTVTRR